MTTTTATRYLSPDWFTRKVFNPLFAWFTRRGISIRGSRILEVRGRRSGEIRTTPVNLLTVDGVRYLVAPRGETQWVRNLRADQCRGVLRLGRRQEPFQATEVADADKTPILRAYLAGVGVGGRPVLRGPHGRLPRRRRGRRGTRVPGVPARLSDARRRHMLLYARRSTSGTQPSAPVRVTHSWT